MLYGSVVMYCSELNTVLFSRSVLSVLPISVDSEIACYWVYLVVLGRSLVLHVIHMTIVHLIESFR